LRLVELDLLKDHTDPFHGTSDASGFWLKMTSRRRFQAFEGGGSFTNIPTREKNVMVETLNSRLGNCRSDYDVLRKSGLSSHRDRTGPSYANSYRLYLNMPLPSLKVSSAEQGVEKTFDG